MVPKMVARSTRYQEDDVTLMDVNCNVSICEGLVPFWSGARLGKWAIIIPDLASRAMSHPGLETRGRPDTHWGPGPFIQPWSSPQSSHISHWSHLYSGPGGQKAEAISALLALSIIQIVALSIFMTVYLRGWYPYPIIPNWGRYRIIFRVLITSTQVFLPRQWSVFVCDALVSGLTNWLSRFLPNTNLREWAVMATTIYSPSLIIRLYFPLIGLWASPLIGKIRSGISSIGRQ